MQEPNTNNQPTDEREEQEETLVSDDVREVAEQLPGYQEYLKENQRGLTFGDY